MNFQEDSDDSGNDDSSINDPEPSLASILQFLLQSGQVRLVRSGGIGAFEVSVHSSRNADTSDEDAEHQRTPPSPNRDYQPDLTNMNGSELKSILLNDGGYYYAQPKNITSRLCQRECKTFVKRSNFTSADKKICSKQYLPNSCEIMSRFRSKAFCGTYSSDGDVFLSSCQDQHIRLYDTSNGNFKLFRDIAARDVGWSVVDTSYSPDQNYIIYSSWSDFIHQCNVYGDHETHQALDLRPEDSRFCAFSISFSRDSKEIVAGCSDHCIYIYDRAKDNRTLKVVAHDDEVNAVTFSGDSANILVSGGDDGICKVWDRRTLSEDNPQPVGLFAGHTDGITHVSAKGDERYFISNSKDQSIKLWDSRRFSSEETVKFARRIVAKQHWDYRWETAPRRSPRLQKGPGNDAIMTYRGHSVLHTLIRAKFSPAHSTGQQYIFTGCATGSVVVYDVLTGGVVTKLKGVHRQCTRDVSWHPYENVIMSSSWDCSIGKWEYCRLAAEQLECELSHDGESKPNNETEPKRRRFVNWVR